MKIRNPLTPAGWIFSVGFLAIVFLIATCTLTGCAGLSVEGKATALYGGFVIAEKAGAELIQSEEVPDAVKLKIQSLDAQAKPFADGLLESLLGYRKIKGDREKETLQKALDNAAAPIANLVGAVSP